MGACMFNQDESIGINRHKRYVMMVFLFLVGLLQVFPVVLSAKEMAHMARVAILPFENMSGRYLVIDDVMKPIYQNLDKIFVLSTYEEVDEVILKHRLRHTGFVNSQEASEIGAKLQVEAIILGMICVYEEIPEPRIGLIIKMIGTGEGTPILWMKSYFARGGLTHSWFGLNRILNIDDLMNKAIRDIRKEMPIDFSKQG